MSEDVKTSKVAKKQSIADVAKYEAKTVITPAASNIHMSNTMLGTASNELALGAMADSIADKASDALAVINATEAAKTPGRKLFPGINKATANFNEIYTSEEYNNVLLQSQKLIRENESLVARNPTAENLATFQKNTMSGLGSLVGQVSEGNKARLGRALEGAYSSAYQSLDERVYAKNQQVIEKEFKGNLEQNLKDIGNKNYAGDRPAVEFTKKQALENIKNAEARESISHMEARNYEAMVELEDEQTLSNYRAMIEEKAGNGEAHLKSLIETPPADGDYAKRDSIALGTAKYLSQYRSLVKGQQNLDYMQAELSLAQGGIPAGAWADLKEKLSPQDFLSLQIQAEKGRSEVSAAENYFQFLDANKNNVAATAEISGTKKADAAMEVAFNQERARIANQEGAPRELSLEEKIKTAAPYNIEVPSLGKQVSAVAKLGAPDQAIAALNATIMAQSNGKPVVDGLDKEAQALTDVYKSLRGSLSPQDALIVARNQTTNLDDKVVEERSRQYREKTDAFGWKTTSGLKYATHKAINVPEADLPAGVTEEFRQLQETFFKSTGDWDIAKEKAAEVIHKNYGWTDINGYRQFMKYSPEKLYPNQSSTTWLRNQMVMQSFSAFEAMKGIYDQRIKDGQAASPYFEFDSSVVHGVNNPLEESMVNSRWFSPDHATAYKVDGDEKIAGRIVLMPDPQTETPLPGKSPSYAVYFQGPAGLEIIEDPRTFNVMRVTPDPKQFEQYVPKGMTLDEYMMAQTLQKERKDRIAALSQGLREDRRQQLLSGDFFAGQPD